MEKNIFTEAQNSTPPSTQKDQAAATSESHYAAINKENNSHSATVLLIVLAVLVLTSLGVFASKPLLTKFPHKITFELREVPTDLSHSKFFALLKTDANLSGLGSSGNYIDTQIASDDSAFKLSLTGTTEKETLPPDFPLGTEDKWSASAVVPLELKDGTNQLKIGNGFSTDRYTITVNPNTLDIATVSSFLSHNSFSKPKSDHFGRNLPIAKRFPDSETNPQAQTELIAMAIKDPTLLQTIANPSENLQLAVVSENYKAIQYLGAPSEKVQLAAVGAYKSADSSRPTPTEFLSWVKNPTDPFLTAMIVLDPSIIQFIKDPSEAVQLALIERDYTQFKFIQNPTDKAYAAIAKRNPRIILDLPEDKQALIVKADPFAIRQLDNPSENTQIASVQTDPSALRNMVNPTEAAQLEAIKKDRFAIQYIKDPTSAAIALAALTDEDMVQLEQMQLDAVKKDWFNFAFFRNAKLISEKVKLEAVTLNPKAIGYMYTPSEAIQLAAIKGDPSVIMNILKPTDAAKALAVKMDPTLIVATGGSSDSLTEAQKIAIVSKDGLALRLITNPSRDVQMAAILNNANAIQNVKDPDEAMQMTAVTHYPKSIKFIKNPAESVLKKALELDPYVDTKYWRD